MNDSTIISAMIFILKAEEMGENEKILVELFRNAGLPFPVLKQVILVTENNFLIDNPFYHFLVDEGCIFTVVNKTEEGFVQSDLEVEVDDINDLTPQYSDYYKGLEEKVTVIYHNKLGEYLTYWFTKWWETLTISQKANYFKAFSKGNIEVDTEKDFILKVKGSNQGALFDFSKKSVTARQEHTFKNKFNLLGEFISTDGVMALIAVKAINQVNSINLWMNNIVNVLEQDLQYGVHALPEYNPKADPRMEIANNSILSLKCELDWFYPWVNFSSQKVSEDALDIFVESGEAFLTDRIFKKDVGGEIAANTAGVGRTLLPVEVDGKEVKLDVMLSNNRSDKPEKFIAGPNQFYRFLKAKVEGWEPMTWGNQLPNGDILYQGGLPLKTAIVETALNHGSGPSMIRPSLKFKCSVRKSGGEGSVEFLSLPKRVRNKLNELGLEKGFTNQSKPGVMYLKEMIREKCESILEQGKIYGPGETILSFGPEFGIEERIICANRELNQDFKVVSYKISENLSDEKSYQPDYFKVKFTVDTLFEDDMVKLRNAYIKLTTLPYEVEWLDHNKNVIPNWGGVDIMLNPETCKSPSIYQAMFIMEMGGGYYNPNTGKVFLKDWEAAKSYFTEEEKERYNSGEEMYLSTTPVVKADYDENGKLQIISQEPKENAIHKWTASRIETGFIKVAVEKSYWEYVSQIIDPSRIEEIEDHGEYVVVTEKIRKLISTYHYEVELSTAREKTSESGITLQQHIHMNALDPALAKALAEEAKESRKSAGAVIEMNTNSPEDLCNKGYETFELNEKGRKTLAQKVGEVVEQNDRKLFERLEKIFPNGVIFLYDYINSKGNKKEITIPLKFNALLKAVGFLTGNADGIGQLIGVFIRYALTCDTNQDGNSDNNKDGIIASLGEAVMKGLTSWFDSIRESKGIFKKMTSTDKIGVNLVVRTSYHPKLHSKDGVPVIILHPDCDGVKKLQKLYGGNINGKILNILRVPMVMHSSFRVKLDKNVGRIAHVFILPHLWAFNNEGDADGDTIFTFPDKESNSEKAKKVNEDILSMGGYKMCYGNDPKNHPFADFCEVPNKKKLDYLWSNNYILTSDYAETCKKVRQHYLGGVSAGYGVASMATFHLNEMMYSSTELDIRYWKLATALSWRLLYEGLGLSGWNPKNEKFYSILNAVIYSKDYTVGLNSKGRYTAKDSDIIGGKINGLKALIELSGFNYTNDNLTEEQIQQVKESAFRRILQAMKFFRSFNALTYGSKAAYFVEKDPNLTLRATIYGSLRQGTQGTDPKGVQQLENLRYGDTESKLRSLHIAVAKEELFETYQCEWVKEVAKDIANGMLDLTASNYLYKHRYD